VRLAVKNTLAKARERIDQMDVPHAVRPALRRDWELVQELALQTVGPARDFRGETGSLACFVASESSYARALRLPWPVRDRGLLRGPLRPVGLYTRSWIRRPVTPSA